MNGEFVEYDESDLESVLEDLEYDEARRRGRRGRRGGRGGRAGVRTTGQAWQPQRAPVAAASASTLRREAEAGRTRDKQLARELSLTKEEIGDAESQLGKVNSDLARLRQISMISLLLPRPLDPAKKKLTIVQPSVGPPQLVETTDQNAPGVEVATNVTSKLDVLPLLLFMMMGRGIGVPAGRARSAASGFGNDMMIPLVLVLLMRQQQAAGGTTTSGSMDPTMLVLIMMMGGGLS